MKDLSLECALRHDMLIAKVEDPFNAEDVNVSSPYFAFARIKCVGKSQSCMVKQIRTIVRAQMIQHEGKSEPRVIGWTNTGGHAVVVPGADPQDRLRCARSVRVIYACESQ